MNRKGNSDDWNGLLSLVLHSYFGYMLHSWTRHRHLKKGLNCKVCITFFMDLVNCKVVEGKKIVYIAKLRGVIQYITNTNGQHQKWSGSLPQQSSSRAIIPCNRISDPYLIYSVLSFVLFHIRKEACFPHCIRNPIQVHVIVLDTHHLFMQL